MTTSNTDITQRVRNFVLTAFPLAQKRSIDNDDSLLESGIIDSLGTLEVVNFLESECGIVVNDEEMVEGNFASINAIAEFVNDKTTGNASVTGDN